MTAPPPKEVTHLLFPGRCQPFQPVFAPRDSYDPLQRTSEERRTGLPSGASSSGDSYSSCASPGDADDCAGAGHSPWLLSPAVLSSLAVLLGLVFVLLLLWWLARCTGALPPTATIQSHLSHAPTVAASEALRGAGRIVMTPKSHRL